jgi:hypothetical protein
VGIRTSGVGVGEGKGVGEAGGAVVAEAVGEGVGVGDAVAAWGVGVAAGVGSVAVAVAPPLATSVRSWPVKTTATSRVRTTTPAAIAPFKIGPSPRAEELRPSGLCSNVSVPDSVRPTMARPAQHSAR